MDVDWFAVRNVFRHVDRRTYEERITVWQAASHEEASALAAVEAAAYIAGDESVVRLSLVQTYHLFAAPGHGAEVFSLMRDSDLGPEEYLDQYFMTGHERAKPLGRD